MVLTRGGKLQFALGFSPAPGFHSGIITPMKRRQFLSVPALALGPSAFAQMASRGVTPSPRGKPSDLPFNAKFTNVARSAGLTSPVIYGDQGRAD